MNAVLVCTPLSESRGQVKGAFPKTSLPSGFLWRRFSDFAGVMAHGMTLAVKDSRAILGGNLRSALGMWP